jgi:hypothetical protein
MLLPFVNAGIEPIQSRRGLDGPGAIARLFVPLFREKSTNGLPGAAFEWKGRCERNGRKSRPVQKACAD